MPGVRSPETTVFWSVVAVSSTATGGSLTGVTLNVIVLATGSVSATTVKFSWTEMLSHEHAAIAMLLLWTRRSIEPLAGATNVKVRSRQLELVPSTLPSKPADASTFEGQIGSPVFSSIRIFPSKFAESIARISKSVNSLSMTALPPTV